MYSVVIPSYNHDKYLGECLLSALREPLVAEILVSDDGSKDGSAQFIEEVSKCYPTKIKNLTSYPKLNIGADASLNKLITNASCKWIAVLNSDDMFIPGRFSAIKSVIQVTKCDFCFGNISIIDELSRVVGKKRAFCDPQYPFPLEVRSHPGQDELLKLLTCQNYIATTSNMVFSKSLWERVGGFRPYRYVHDWDFALRAMLLGNAVYVPEYLTYYRIHASNTILEGRDGQNVEVQALFLNLKEEFGSGIFDLYKKFILANQYLEHEIFWPL